MNDLQRLAQVSILVELAQDSPDLTLGMIGRSAFPEAAGDGGGDGSQVVSAVAVGEDQRVYEFNRSDCLAGSGETEFAAGGMEPEVAAGAGVAAASGGVLHITNVPPGERPARGR